MYPSFLPSPPFLRLGLSLGTTLSVFLFLLSIILSSRDIYLIWYMVDGLVNGLFLLSFRLCAHRRSAYCCMVDRVPFPSPFSLQIGPGAFNKTTLLLLPLSPFPVFGFSRLLYQGIQFLLAHLFLSSSSFRTVGNHQTCHRDFFFCFFPPFPFFDRWSLFFAPPSFFFFFLLSTPHFFILVCCGIDNVIAPPLFLATISVCYLT